MNFESMLVEAPKASEITLEETAEGIIGFFFETGDSYIFELNGKNYKIGYRKDLEEVAVMDERNNVLFSDNDFEILVELLVVSAEYKLFLRGEEYPVRSLEEAQNIFIAKRNEHMENGGGSRDFEDGLINGYNISWNGRVWFEGSLVLE